MYCRSLHRGHRWNHRAWVPFFQRRVTPRPGIRGFDTRMIWALSDSRVRSLIFATLDKSQLSHSSTIATSHENSMKSDGVFDPRNSKEPRGPNRFRFRFHNPTITFFFWFSFSNSFYYFLSRCFLLHLLLAYRYQLHNTSNISQRTSLAHSFLYSS